MKIILTLLLFVIVLATSSCEKNSTVNKSEKTYDCSILPLSEVVESKDRNLFKSQVNCYDYKLKKDGFNLKLVEGELTLLIHNMEYMKALYLLRRYRSRLSQTTYLTLGMLEEALGDKAISKVIYQEVLTNYYSSNQLKDSELVNKAFVLLLMNRFDEAEKITNDIKEDSFKETVSQVLYQYSQDSSVNIFITTNATP